jgi:inhibitor of cysteine peptidase
MNIDVLTDADAGLTRQVKAGEIVELRLEENPSTGYQWTVNFEPPDGAIIAASAWLGLSGLGASQVVGGSGIRAFDITTKHPGLVTLRAKRSRSWEGEDSEVERKSFVLEVQATKVTEPDSFRRA